MNFILKKDFKTPCFTIRAGVSKTEKEWINIFRGLQEGDCSIKADWFEADKFSYINIYDPCKVINNGQEIKYSEKDVRRILEFLSKLKPL